MTIAPNVKTRRGIKRAGAAKLAPARGASVEVPRTSKLFEALSDKQGKVLVDRVADSFGMSRLQIVETAGISRTAMYKPKRLESPKAQERMREMLEIVSRVAGWAGGRAQGMAWYRAEPIPAFGGRTAESLVKAGKASALRDYLDALAMGGFA
jgi:antitoxin Xre/MbcA/ParS-like protein